MATLHPVIIWLQWGMPKAIQAVWAFNACVPTVQSGRNAPYILSQLLLMYGIKSMLFEINTNLTNFYAIASNVATKRACALLITKSVCTNTDAFL